MKYLKYFLFLLLIPFIVFAEECDITKITITSINQTNITGNTEEIADPEASGKSINLNLKMYEVGDSITYDMIINNDSEEDYMIDEDTFKTDSEYIEYTLKTNDNTNVVKAKSSKDVTLTVTYKKEVDDSLLTNNKYNAFNSLKLSLNTSDKEKPLDVITTDNTKNSVEPQVKNPITSISSIKKVIILLLAAVILIYFTIKNKKKLNKYVLIILFLSTTSIIYAACKCDIEVESNIIINKAFDGNGNVFVNIHFDSVTNTYHPKVGDSISPMTEEVMVTKWCTFAIDDTEREDGYCEYNNETECNDSIRYCMKKTDNSWNSCLDENYGFGDETTCLNIINEDVNSGRIEAGEYTCARDTSTICASTQVLDGDYTYLRNNMKKKAYYKYYVENYVIKETYLCFKTDKEYCLKGEGEGHIEYNYNIIKQQEEWFINKNGTCSFNIGEHQASCGNGDYLNYVFSRNDEIELSFKDKYDRIERRCIYEGISQCGG